jgi:hypothetical protein
MIEFESSHGNPMYIKEKVFIITSDWEVDVDGKQIFRLINEPPVLEGYYLPGQHRIEGFVDGLIRITPADGGIIEIDKYTFKINENLPEGTKLFVRYFQNLSQELLNQHAWVHEYGSYDPIKGLPYISEIEPVDNIYAGMIWIK